MVGEIYASKLEKYNKKNYSFGAKFQTFPDTEKSRVFQPFPEITINQQFPETFQVIVNSVVSWTAVVEGIIHNV